MLHYFLLHEAHFSMKKKVIIIGAGISGLSAGIFAQKNNFDSIILERHLIPGGECTGWDRQGYHIDSCIHWMVGTLPGTETYQLWEELHALGPDIPIISHPAYLRFDNLDGQQFHLWNDLERMQKELEKLSPKDQKAIRKLVSDIRNYAVIESVTTRPIEQQTLWDKTLYFWKIRKAIVPHIRRAKQSVLELSKQFHNDFIGQTMLTYLPETFYAEALLYMYAVVTSGKAGIPKGGSRAMAFRMRDYYESLGGKMRCKAEVERIVVEGNRAKGVLLKDGTTIEADAVIAACDPHVTLHHLLENKYTDSYFKKRYEDKEKYPLFSHACIYYGCKTQLQQEDADTIAFKTSKPFIMAGRKQQSLLVKSYQYEPGFAPEGHTVLQILILQNEADYDYYKHLRDTNLEGYKAEKQRIGEYVAKELEAHFPELKDQLELIEFTTPYSLTRFCRAYKGAYMPFVTKPRVARIFHHGRIRNLKGLYLASQWLQPPGGLINAAITGKFAILRLMHDEGKEVKR